MPIPAIDTHIHCWDPQEVRYSWLDKVPELNKPFPLSELEEARLENDITGGVLVQAANSLEDTNFMLVTARNYAWIKGVVGWLPLMDPDRTNELIARNYYSEDLLVGIRHLIHDEADPRWILQDAVVESLQIISAAGLTYDFVGVKLVHLESALDLMSRIPTLRMVFDHLNQPPGKAADFDRWKSMLKEAAQNGNVYAKISGLGTAVGKGAGWSVDDIKSSIAFVLEQFGEDRCFCGGDWPVSLLAGTYMKTWTAYREALEGLLDHNARQKVLYGNATEFYSLVI